MNSKKLILIIALSLFAFALMLRAEDLQIDKSETYLIKKGDQFYFNVSSGDILVKTWNKMEVLIQISKFDKDEKTYEVVQRDNKLMINYNRNWDWASDNNLIITIPNQLLLDFRTGNGDIIFENSYKGSIQLKTNSGDISVRQVSGSLSIMSSGGDITCGDIDGNLAAETMGGDITVSNVTGNCSLDTKGGDIKSKNISGNMNAVTYGGDIEIGTVKRNLFVTTYGGDIEIQSSMENAKLISYAGDIILNKSVGKVEIKASAGDIRLNDCDGAVNLNSLSGDIYVSLNPKDRSIIKSNYGDIEVLIPSNSKVNIIASSKTAFDGEKLISSDFESFLTEEKIREGSSKKIYSINGGGNASIDLKANNAKILIKKK